MSCGIYKITNLINGKSYIGQSSMIERRWSEEKRNKNNGKKLEKAINKYGIKNFSFEILEECLQEELNLKEMNYIEKFNSVKNGYNITLGGEGYRLYKDSEKNRKEKQRLYKIKNRDKIKKFQKKYVIEHKEEKSLYDSNYRKVNKEKIEEYRKNNNSYLKKLRKCNYKKEKNTVCFFEGSFLNLNALRAKLQYRYGSGKQAKKYIVKFFLLTNKVNSFILLKKS